MCPDISNDEPVVLEAMHLSPRRRRCVSPLRKVVPNQYVRKMYRRWQRVKACLTVAHALPNREKIKTTHTMASYVCTASENLEAHPSPYSGSHTTFCKAELIPFKGKESGGGEDGRWAQGLCLAKHRAEHRAQWQNMRLLWVMLGLHRQGQNNNTTRMTECGVHRHLRFHCSLTDCGVSPVLLIHRGCDSSDKPNPTVIFPHGSWEKNCEFLCSRGQEKRRQELMAPGTI